MLYQAELRSLPETLRQVTKMPPECKPVFIGIFTGLVLPAPICNSPESLSPLPIKIEDLDVSEIVANQRREKFALRPPDASGDFDLEGATPHIDKL